MNSQQNKRRSKEAGLIELLVVITIIALLASISVAVFGAYQRKAKRLKEQAAQEKALVLDNQGIDKSGNNSTGSLPPTDDVRGKDGETEQSSPASNESKEITSLGREKIDADEYAAKKQFDDALTDPKILLLFIGAGFGIIAFTYKQLLGHLIARSELGLTETLSIHEGIDRAELAEKSKKAFRHMWWIPGTFTDALASLHVKGKVEVSNGKYSLATKPTDADSKKKG